MINYKKNIKQKYKMSMTLIIKYLQLNFNEVN